MSLEDRRSKFEQKFDKIIKKAALNISYKITWLVSDAFHIEPSITKILEKLPKHLQEEYKVLVKRLHEDNL